MTASLSALALYTGLLGLIALWLLANVGKRKAKAKVSIGDGGDMNVIRAMRGQLNFMENVPLALIILLIISAMNAPVWIIHVSGILLVVGRFFHAWHFIQDDAPGWQRALGALTAFLVIAICSLGLIGHGIYGML